MKLLHLLSFKENQKPIFNSNNCIFYIFKYLSFHDLRNISHVAHR